MKIHFDPLAATVLAEQVLLRIGAFGSHGAQSHSVDYTDYLNAVRTSELTRQIMTSGQLKFRERAMSAGGNFLEPEYDKDTELGLWFEEQSLKSAEPFVHWKKWVGGDDPLGCAWSKHEFLLPLEPNDERLKQFKPRARGKK